MNKYLLLSILTISSIFLSFWIFNHINSWIGIGYGLLSAYFSIQTLLKYLKNKNN